jgi:hypothetical protein
LLKSYQRISPGPRLCIVFRSMVTSYIRRPCSATSAWKCLTSLYACMLGDHCLNLPRITVPPVPFPSAVRVILLGVLAYRSASIKIAAPSVRMKQDEIRFAYFREICYFSVSLKFIDTSKFWLKSYDLHTFLPPSRLCTSLNIIGADSFKV